MKKLGMTGRKRFFNDKTEVIKRSLCVNYKHDLKAIISYKFSYNDNKIIILYLQIS